MPWKVLRELLFWAAVLMGAGLLAPSLLVPAWFDHQAQREYMREHRRHVAALQYQLRATQIQLEHLKKDPAYLLRLAQQEFGGGIAVPQAEPVYVDPNAPPPEEPPELAAYVPDAVPELTAFVQQVMDRHPYAQLFRDSRRVPLMALGGILLLTGVLLMGLTDGDPPRQRTARGRRAAAARRFEA